MTGLHDATSSDSGPTPGADRGRLPVRRWLLLPAVAALLFVPLEGAVALAGVGVAVLLLLWGLWPRPARPPGGGPGPLLVGAAGVAMLLGLFLAANPWWGTVTHGWPWDAAMKRTDWASRIDVAVWGALAVLAVLVALRRPVGAWPYTLLITASVFLAARGHAARHREDLVCVEGLPLLWTLSAFALLGGLVHLASAERRGRSVARALVLSGVAGMATLVAMAFHDDGEGSRWVAARLVDDWRPTLDGWVRGGELDPETRRHFAERLWFGMAPFLLQVAGWGLALLAAALPVGRAARGPRYVAILAVLTLVLVWLVPLRAESTFEFPVLPDLPAPAPGHGWARLLLRTSIALCFLVAGAVSVLLRRVPDRRTAPAPARRVPAGAVPRWAYLVGALVTLALIVHGFRPGAGAVYQGAIRDLFHPFAWSTPTATLTLLGLLALAAMGAYFFPVGPWRGWIPATLALATWGILPPGEPVEYGVSAYVGTAATALAAAALWAARSGGARARALARHTAGGAGLLLLFLFVHPMSLAPRMGGVVPLDLPVARFFRWGEAADGVGVWAAATLPWRVNMLGQALVALLALHHAVTGRARGAAVAVGAMVATVGFGVLRNGLTDAPDVAAALLGLGEAARVLGAPMAFVWLNAVHDLGRITDAHESPPPVLAGPGGNLPGAGSV